MMRARLHAKQTPPAMDSRVMETGAGLETTATCGKQHAHEREIVSDVLVSLPLFDVVFCPTLLFSLTLRANDAPLLFF